MPLGPCERLAPDVMQASSDALDLITDDRAPALALDVMMSDDDKVSKLAKAFFMAATKESEDEDILPQVQNYM